MASHRPIMALAACRPEASRHRGRPSKLAAEAPDGGRASSLANIRPWVSPRIEAQRIRLAVFGGSDPGIEGRSGQARSGERLYLHAAGPPVLASKAVPATAFNTHGFTFGHQIQKSGTKGGTNVHLPHKPLILLDCWRRGRDSNPRYACAHAGFRDRAGFLTLSNRSRASRYSLICHARSSDKAAQKGLDFLCKRSVTGDQRPKTKGQAA